MEDIHGVDVSWIQHSQRERNPRPHRPSTAPDLVSNLTAGSSIVNAPETPGKSPGGPLQDVAGPAIPVANLHAAPAPIVPTKSNGHSSPATPIQPKRPGLLHRGSREKISNQAIQIDTSRSTPRRSAASSWISSLSSKLSSTPPPASPFPLPSPGLTQSHSGSNAPPPTPTSSTPLPSPAVPTIPPAEDTRPYVPQAPRSGGAGFFANALRRLSSSSQLGGTPGARSGSASSPGGVVQRRVMNIDPNRTRCLLPELEQKKLRRVAFCVDVEIAGARPKDDEGEGLKRRRDEVKLREADEGQALKDPDGVLMDKDKDMDGEKLEVVEDEKKETSRKKEKKKRSEEERKERKELKRRKAEECGTIPMQITLPTNTSSNSDLSGPSTPPRPIDRPTTDPLRIYRRCCQLRETPILKRITEQLAAPPTCPIGGPGVIMSLNLTGSRLQLADIVTLSDWLAIVPVKKLILEDSDLNDEAVRVVLAGLLAAMTPDFTKISRALNRQRHEERSGLIEKLVLKNNPKITKEGWKHISLFLYMCKSLKSLDVSMNVFPKSPAGENRAHEDVRSHPDTVDIFAKAISERLGGSHFEELIMGECGLCAYQVRRIVDAVLVSGVKRLGLADNGIGPEALEHVARYIASGVCQGVDLAGNDLLNHLDILGTAFKPDCPLWALSIADCNLDAKSLGPLMQGLFNLQNLRFLDLSHNPELFGIATPTTPFDEESTAKYPSSALSLLRKYLPLLPAIRRIHLNNVSMSPAQAIALADVLAECPYLAHLSIRQNPSITALAGATTEELQEEAVALYASLMVAARVSHSIISIDVDVPTAENSEIVKALAKQVVAYCLRNLELFYSPTVDDGSSSKSVSSGPPGDTQQAATEMEVPEVILQLVGTSDGHFAAHPDVPAPDRDYIVGGTGVVKALNYCLLSQHRGSSQSTSGTSSPPVGPINGRVIGAKVKNMSKNLLESARKIRARMQPALVREARGEDDMAFRRLLFLDNTLKAIINRFEDEYPETRVTPAPGISSLESPSPPPSSPTSPRSAADAITAAADGGVDGAVAGGDAGAAAASGSSGSYFQSESDGSLSDDAASPGLERRQRRHEQQQRQRPGGGRPRSRQSSDVSLAAKKLAQEEGAVHRLGTEVWRKLLERAAEAEAEGGSAAAAQTVSAIIDAGEKEEERARAEDVDEHDVKGHVRALKEKLRALESGV